MGLQDLSRRAIRHDRIYQHRRFRQPGAVDDPLTEVLRAGARQLLAQVIKLEAAAFLAARDDLRLQTGGRA
jgi:hypothetical protein